MADKRYYWLKLKDDFFEDDTINWLEEQENGKDYVIFYLKLCLKSLSNDGYLIRYVGEMLLPYDVKALAKLTDTHPDTVAVAMKTFVDIGLIERLDSGEIYLKQIDEMVGSETEAAIRKRRSRARLEVQKSTGQIEHKKEECDIVTDTSQNVTHSKSKSKRKELEKEKETETDEEPENSNGSKSDINVHQFYQQNFGVETPFIVEDLEFWIKDLNEELVFLALQKAIEKGAAYSYAKAIMKNWTDKNIKTVEQARSESLQRQKQSKGNWKGSNSTARAESLPDWLSDDYEAPEEEMTEEEKKAAEQRTAEMLKRIRERKREVK